MITARILKLKQYRIIQRIGSDSTRSNFLLLNSKDAISWQLLYMNYELPQNADCLYVLLQELYKTDSKITVASPDDLRHRD